MILNQLNKTMKKALSNLLVNIIYKILLEILEDANNNGIPDFFEQLRNPENTSTT